MANFVQLQNLPFVPVYNQNVYLLALQYPKTKSSIKTKKMMKYLVGNKKVCTFVPINKILFKR